MENDTTQLDIIYRMMSEFTSSADINRVLYRGLDYIREQIGAEAASFFYLHDDKQTLRCDACIGPIDITGLELPATQGIVGAVTQSDAMRFVADVSNDPDFTRSVDAKTGFETRSMICVPVSGNGYQYGAIQLINRQDGGFFSENDAALVSVYGKSAALALTNSQLTSRMIEADAIKRDLNMASRVQASLFPDQPYPHIFGVNLPKKGVSGDLYDYVERDGQLYFCMADVSGKGTDAALVMAKTHSLFRSLTRAKPSPAELSAQINRELVETAFNGMFVTAIIGVYDPQSGDMSCCNAGHEPGLLINADQSYDHVEASLQPLGILEFEAEDIETETHNLSEKRFYCYSDGITEAEVGGQMIGAIKLAQILSQQMDLPLAAQIENTVQAVKQRASLLPDDLTVLGLGCPPRASTVPEPEVALVEPGLAGENLLFSIAMVNAVPELRRMRRELEAALADTPALHRIGEIQLAVDEALQNIIRHAFADGQDGQITVSGYIAGELLNISIVDTAPLIDLEKVKPRALDDLREGGLGTHFIMTLAETANWSHDNGQNRLDISFAI